METGPRRFWRSFGTTLVIIGAAVILYGLLALMFTVGPR